MARVEPWSRRRPSSASARLISLNGGAAALPRVVLIMFKHILVATDGSPLADKAVATALQLSSFFGRCPVTLLMVVPDYTAHEFAAAVFGGLADVDDARRRLAEAGQARLAEILQHHPAPHLHVQPRVAVSDFPYEEIVRTAEHAKCDLVVLAWRGQGAMKSHVAGSQTAHVLALSKVPVLVVK
jgi:nucleotide-binding universal stress UspA family protein